MSPIIVQCAQCGKLTETQMAATARRVAGQHRRAFPDHAITVKREDR